MNLPFDLELAKQGHSVISRGGWPVRIICFDIKSNPFPIMALHELINNKETPIVHTQTGSCNSRNEEDDCDLFMFKEEKEYYINIYKDENGIPFLGQLFEKQPSLSDSPNYLKTISFKI